MTTETVLTVTPSTFCVYHHLRCGKVFYVGAGTPTRAFTYAGRNQFWHEAIGKSRVFDVAIVRWFSDRKEAHAFEVAEIKRLLPQANVRHGYVVSDAQKRFYARNHKRKSRRIVEYEKAR